MLEIANGTVNKYMVRNCQEPNFDTSALGNAGLAKAGDIIWDSSAKKSVATQVQLVFGKTMKQEP